MSNLHSLIEGFGSPIEPGQLADRYAAQLAAYLSDELYCDARLRQCFAGSGGYAGQAEAVLLDIRAERPQDRAADIRRWEPIFVGFPGELQQPRVDAARIDFPYTAHQFAVPPGYPKSLCIDERPWDDARASWTPFSFLELIRVWLGAAAAGRLTGEGQAVEPRFLGVTQGIVLPRSALDVAGGGPDLAAWIADPATERLVIARPPDAAPHGAPHFRIASIFVPPQISGPMRSIPRNMGELAAEMTACGCDLMETLRNEVLAAPGRPGGYGVKLIFVVVIPTQRESGGPLELLEVRAFVSSMPLGEIGCKLGLLDEAREANLDYVRTVGLPRPVVPAEIPVSMLQVHFDFDRASAAACSGTGSIDRRKVVLVGAGAIGSHISVTLAREGRFDWTVIDPDILLPHNLARHALMPADIGRQKAVALCSALNGLLGTGSATPIVADILDSHDAALLEAINSAIVASDVVLDASASVSVARALADREGISARMASVFLNPAGTATVLLVEDSARECRLDALEGQYYRLVLNDEKLLDHLVAPTNGFRYAGACRSITNRIPASSVSILGSLAARAIAAALADASAAINVWALDSSGEVHVHSATVAPVLRSNMGAWEVLHDAALDEKLLALRQSFLPTETGGVLVGIVDTARRVIVIVDALPAPDGSIGTEEGFERGTEGLAASLAGVADRTGGQVRYVGEWHSHPAGQPASPSPTDLKQLDFLRAEMRRDSLPALIMIAGTDSEVSVISLDDLPR